MANPKKKDVWDVSALEQAREVSSVSAAGGLMLAGGASALYRMRPGMHALQVRPFPFPGLIRAVAVEPTRPHRAAVVSDGELVLWDFARDAVGFQHVKLDPSAPKANALAWGMVKGRSVLHVLGDDNVVLRSMPGHPLEEIPLEGAVALVNDPNGLLGILTDDGRLYVSDNGENWKFRQLPLTLFGHEPHVAIRGMTAAIEVDGALWISRGEDDPFDHHEEVSQAGALAVGDDDAIYVVEFEGEARSLVCVRAGEDMTRILETTSAPVSLAWDASRSALWWASEDGLVMVSAADSKKATLS
jgi:hypothetical protein